MVKTSQTNVDAGAERDFQCQRAMSDQFQLLTASAERAGWSWDEIAMALLELTDDYVAAVRAPAETFVAHAKIAPRSNTRH